MWCSPFLSILFPVLHRDVAIPFRVVAQGGGRPDVGVSGADRGYQAVFVYGGNAPGVGGPAQGRVQVRVGRLKLRRKLDGLPRLQPNLLNV